MLFWWTILIQWYLLHWANALADLNLLYKNTSKGFITYCPCMGKILFIYFF